jgi:transcription initiation factor TFIIIB Brf1 subunit/transcription initiation factor TFIIB
MLTSKVCPYCGAVDSLDVNYLRGEVACNECAVVCQTGLLEDPRTEWGGDEGTVHTHGDRQPKVTTTRGRGDAGSKGDAKSTRAYHVLCAIRDRCNVPQSIVEVAQGYFDRYSAITATKQSGSIETVTLAAGCFFVAARLRFYPVPAAEIASFPFLRGVSPSKIDAVKLKLLPELKLDTDWIAVQPQFFEHLVAYYGRRLRPRPLTPKQCQIAAAIAKAFATEVSGKGEAAVAQFAIYKTLVDPAADPLRRLVAAAEEPRTENVEEVQQLVSQCARDDSNTLATMLRNHSLTPAMVTAALTELQKSAAELTTSTVADDPMVPDRKRERDEEA